MRQRFNTLFTVKVLYNIFIDTVDGGNRKTFQIPFETPKYYIYI